MAIEVKGFIDNRKLDIRSKSIAYYGSDLLLIGTKIGNSMKDYPT